MSKKDLWQIIEVVVIIYGHPVYVEFAAYVKYI